MRACAQSVHSVKSPARAFTASSFVAGGFKFVFLPKDHILLVMAARTGESVAQVRV
jgi:hypothetical protein